MVDSLNGNWALFFVITAVMVIPGLFLLLAISRVFKRRERDALRAGDGSAVPSEPQ